MIHSVKLSKHPFKGKTPKQVADTLKARSALAGLIQPALGAAAGVTLDTSSFIKTLDTIGHGITGLNFSELAHGAERAFKVSATCFGVFPLKGCLDNFTEWIMLF